MSAGHELAAGELFRIPNPRGVQVEVVSGRLWITEEARNDDIWLAAGENVRLSGEGLAVLEAIGPTCVHFA